MLTIVPPPRSIIPGMACLQHRNVPRALTAKTSSHTSSGVSGGRGRRADPGDVDEDVRVVDRGADGGLVADVETAPRRTVAQLLGERAHAIAGDVGEDDVGALAVQPAGDCGADARAGPGHERAPAG